MEEPFFISMHVQLAGTIYSKLIKHLYDEMNDEPNIKRMNKFLIL